MAPSYSGVWKLQTKYQYSSAFPIDTNLEPTGLFAGGQDSSAVINTVQKIIPTIAGNSTDFGDLSAVRQATAGGGSDTRFLVAGGYQASKVNIIEYFTYTTAGNATDFGDIGATRDYLSSTSNNTRFITMGGASATNTIEYVTIASTGNAQDFGDLTATLEEGHVGVISSVVRGILAGGKKGGSRANVIEYLTIASTGNGRDFGDMTASRNLLAGGSSSTRGLMIGGDTGSGTGSNVIDFITIVTGGNATDFGDTSGNRTSSAALSSSTKAIVAGGNNNGSQTNIIESVTIASAGNATDFGDLLTVNKFLSAGCADQASVQPNVLPSLPSAGNTGLMVNTTASFIQSIDIATAGNAVEFGDVSYGGVNGSYGGASSATRMCVAGGLPDGYVNNIDLTIFATRGLGTDFGDLTTTRLTTGGSNSTRGMYGGGKDSGASRVDTIDYITIASAGNATDFGNLVEALEIPGMAGNTTRMLFMGGRKASGSGTGGYSNQIGYVTISSTGNTTDFGDLLETNGFGMATSSSTRVVHCGGYTGTAGLNRIQYLTTASTGNATDFGDLLSAWTQGGAFSNSTRALVLGGYNYTTNATQDVIQQFTIASTGDSTDFGDLLSASGGSGQSNGHGGIS